MVKPYLKVRPQFCRFYTLLLVAFALTTVPFSPGHLDTFKHLKKDITEAGKGLECGLSIGGFGGLEVGDLIQAFEKIEKPGIL